MHERDHPLQLAFKETFSDDPSLADYKAHEVENGDIFIVGSDGLFDNLHVAQVIDLIRPFIQSSDTISDPAKVAEIISREAENLSK